jgi:methenyltetrahydrofolate cyclohydrolase
MDDKIAAFLKVMDVSDNSTGGGSASAIAGAMAAGLAGMVARLSIGKKDLAPTEHYEKIADRAETLCKDLFDGGRRDSDAFAVVSDAFGMPRGTDKEKTARRAAIKKGMTLCAEVPLQNALQCLQVLEICSQLNESYNTSASSDLECARHLATAGIKGCAANVRVNLPYLKDEKQVRDLEDRIDTILKQTL